MSHAFVALQLRVRSFYLPPRMVLAAGLLGYGLNTREEEPAQCVIAFPLVDVDETITFDRFRFRACSDLDTCARVLWTNNTHAKAPTIDLRLTPQLKQPQH
ncbi:hypothetical protein BO85DRAFT_493704 [Aspergillus piperis CBS 112811]|uniref:Uncharacterized protein n=1 Tax=Aspergillus piperis CBS 112811 TaxID=1448313 RepID=A0A8G1VIG3_9EURO|nr:hypothetical protein BO85DRAFT_493704 [Aspergillus piperis CBS 112811]RAH51683.1 hypothetical protein BO85DRAFT_493704 [Aspergillus piperis CBS 112811]